MEIVFGTHKREKRGQRNHLHIMRQNSKTVTDMANKNIDIVRRNSDIEIGLDHQNGVVATDPDLENASIAKGPDLVTEGIGIDLDPASVKSGMVPNPGDTVTAIGLNLRNAVVMTGPNQEIASIVIGVTGAAKEFITNIENREIQVDLENLNVDIVAIRNFWIADTRFYKLSNGEQDGVIEKFTTEFFY